MCCSYLLRGDVAQDGIVARCYSEEITTRSVVARNDDEEMIFKKGLLLVAMTKKLATSRFSVKRSLLLEDLLE
ncbi:hypothetical protein L195_g063226 [Trifolium pratense]|uniref:Uncharacterized protein n=1 Tax=Trifolium pratense TaxID=57577 RepID=A0A2K3KKL3_TRIPR|nr:hypothetical protein L195_g063226 [Trifolium pratense]